ncbi:MAG: hypothetical protein M3Q69_15440 [Acidobacteriota bacterium]|nr:hypothetical protein [Acidobacteriota bacterium]
MRIATMLLTLLLGTSAIAGEVFIPATYRGHGANGSDWRTEITVTNISTSTLQPVRTTITYYRENGEAVAIPMILARYEVVTVQDALANWFGVTEGGGLVRITWDDANARIGANARIYNVGGNGGQYGQGVPGVYPERLESAVHLPGLTGIDGNRTNVGVSNPHGADALIWVELIEASGESRGAFATIVPARSYRQLNDIFAHFQAGPLQGAMVRVSSSNSTIYGYASIVRNDSGDPTWVAPAQ